MGKFVSFLAAHSRAYILALGQLAKKCDSQKMGWLRPEGHLVSRVQSNRRAASVIPTTIASNAARQKDIAADEASARQTAIPRSPTGWIARTWRRFDRFSLPIGSLAVAGAVLACVLTTSSAFGQGGRNGHGTDGGRADTDQRNALSDGSRRSRSSLPQPVLTPHCGQYLTTPSATYELVFTLLQLRIFAYDKSMTPQDVKNLRVQLTLTVPGENDPRRIAFQYVAAAPGSGEQDYLAAPFDFGQMRDKEVPLTIEFILPDRRQPVSFSPLFTKAAIRPYVAQVQLIATDRRRAAQQRVCPVSGDVLGSKGPMVKVLIGEHPLYLCSKDCIVAVKQSPEKYLPPVNPPTAGQSM
jgi:hypothetical protein